MKKIAIYAVILLAGVGAAHGQHYIGVRGGWGGGSGRIMPPVESGMVWGLKSGGVSWKHYSAERFVGGIEADVLWMQQGYKQYYTRPIEGSDKRQRVGYYQRTVDVVMVPAMWQAHVYAFNQRLRVFMNAGITFSYILSSEQKDVWYEPASVTGGEYKLKAIRDNRLGYGLAGGPGVSWAIGRMEVFAEARYYLGYSDLMKNRNKYEENPLKSPMDGIQFQAGLYVRLGRGGILSAQGRRAVAVGVPKPAADKPEGGQIITIENGKGDDAPVEGGEADTKGRERDTHAADGGDNTGSDGVGDGGEGEPRPRVRKGLFKHLSVRKGGGGDGGDRAQ